MNNKIPFNRFSQMLAENAGISAAGAEAFVKEFFALVEEQLLESESVDIKGFGRFERSQNVDSPILYTPSEDLAAMVNAPFGLFEPEELNPEVTDEMLSEAGETMVESEVRVEESIEEPESVEELVEPGEDLAEEPIEEPVEEPIEELENESENEPQPEKEPELEPESESEPEPAPVFKPVASTPPPYNPEPLSVDEPKQEATAEESSRGLGFGVGLLLGLLFGIAIGGLAVFMYMSTAMSTGEGVDTLSSEEGDSAAIEYLEQQLEELESLQLPEGVGTNK